MPSSRLAEALRASESTATAEVRSPHLQQRAADLASALTDDAQRALALLNADGVAIVLAIGESFVCSAVAGDLTPPVGHVVEADAKLTQECIRTRRVIISSDRASDNPLGADFANSGVRSLLIAPVFSNDRLIGVLEVFARDAGWSERSDRDLVQSVTKSIAATCERHASPLADSSHALSTPTFETSVSASLPLRRSVIVGVSILVLAVVLLLVWARVQQSAGAASATFVEPPPQSSGVSLESLKKAAEDGNVGAQSALGAFYWTGNGVAQQNEAAYMWSAIAASAGDINSANRLQLLRGAMSQAEVQRAEALAANWRRQHLRQAPSRGARVP